MGNVTTRIAQCANKSQDETVRFRAKSRQIYHCGATDQWTPRGKALRCLLGDNEEGQLVVAIDNHELSLAEFGRLLATCAGWGMRIEFSDQKEIAPRLASKSSKVKRRKR